MVIVSLSLNKDIVIHEDKLYTLKLFHVRNVLFKYKCFISLTLHPVVAFQPQKVVLHSSHTLPMVFRGHLHWPPTGLHTLSSVVHPHATK